MNKIVASVGLVALGAASLNAAPPPSKPWSVSATLRGFYDDNPSTLPEGSHKKDSFGFEVRPTVDFNVDNGQTRLQVGYAYSLRYYDNKPVGNTSNYDQDHTFNVLVNHAFNERYQIAVRDSFVIGQEPDVLANPDTGAVGTFQRIPGNNIRNYGAIVLDGWLTPIIGFEAGYDNSLADYEADELSATFDRIEHRAHVDGRWRVQPETVAVLGYEFGLADFTGDQIISLGPPVLMSDARNRRTHTLYVGADHNFLPDLSGSIRAGAKFADYYNAPTDESRTSPYARASLRYTYAPESYVEAGASYDLTSTDVIGAVGDSFVRDADTVLGFASVRHQIVPKLFGNLIGQIQNSSYNGGTANGKSDLYYRLGVNLDYWIGPNLAAQVGYNFDKVSSDIGRDYERNRVYIGVIASY